MEISAERNDHFGLSLNDVDVWQIELNQFDQHINLMWELLSTSEQEQALRFRFGSDKRNYVLTYGALRLLLARYLDCSPHSLRYQWSGSQLDAVTCGPLSAENRHVIRCTLSYTDSTAMIAIGRSQTVGIDIKKVEKISEQDAIIDSYFSEQEQLMMSGMPAQNATRMFYSFLALKSAICKAEYGVYTTPLKEVDVTSIEAHVPIKFDSPSGTGNWFVHSLNLNESHAAAIAVSTSVERLCRRVGSPELLVEMNPALSEAF